VWLAGVFGSLSVLRTEGDALMIATDRVVSGEVLITPRYGKWGDPELVGREDVLSPWVAHDCVEEIIVFCPWLVGGIHLAWSIMATIDMFESPLVSLSIMNLSDQSANKLCVDFAILFYIYMLLDRRQRNVAIFSSQLEFHEIVFCLVWKSNLGYEFTYEFHITSVGERALKNNAFLCLLFAFLLVLLFHGVVERIIHSSFQGPSRVISWVQSSLSVV